jgi:hypothetical protein
VSVEITVVSVVIIFLRQSHNAFENYTLHVEITLERVVITLVSVVSTRIRLKITLLCADTTVRVKITVMSVLITFVSVKITMRVKITLCVYKSYP